MGAKEFPTDFSNLAAVTGATKLLGDDGATNGLLTINDIVALIGSAIVLQGDWDADTNTPDISGTTTTGYAWRVSVAGSTNLGGITDWKVGDIAVKTASSWLKIDNTEPILLSNTTVTFTTLMTDSERAALIRAQPKNLNGYTLTFVYEDGNHAVEGGQTFEGFHGGTLTVRGNSGEDWTVLHTNQAASIDVTLYDGLDFKSCDCDIRIQNLLIYPYSTPSGHYAIGIEACPSVWIAGCYLYAFT